MDKTIAILAGDGIGPEVMEQALAVLESVAEQYSHKFTYLSADIGGAAFEYSGKHCPDETITVCEQSDAVLFGSVGGPLNEQDLPKWNGCEAASILRLRKHFNLGINIRPTQSYNCIAANSPLRLETIAKGFNFEIFRELTGGIYFGEHFQSIKDNKAIAIDTCEYHQDQVITIAKAAFEAAQLRKLPLCSVDKANVLATSKLWRYAIEEVAKDYPDVKYSHLLVDNCAMQLVLNPSQFGIIVTENMFGDILSDLAAALPGSIGLIPSASLNNNGFGLYEPSGGSAPELAGLNKANPTAQILSAAMMLRYSFGLSKEAKIIEQAVIDTLNDGIMTADLNQVDFVSTTDFTCAVINRL